jgi:penicillin-binding protein 2
VRALTESCDVFFYQVGQKVGIDRLAWYAKACGLGSTTGINLDQESKGLVPNAAWKKQRTGIAWQGGETLSVAIGQSYNLVTPLQMLVLISAVANDGIIYKPLILKTIETDEGKILVKSESRVIGNLPASSPTLQIVKRGLWEVVNNRKGTARIARVAGIEISGKTGTAQVVSSDIYETASKEEREHNLKPHAWFVAYAPSDDPQIAVAVIVEHGEHSSSTAVPIVKELIKTYLSNDKPGNRLKAQRGATDLHQGSNIYVR